MAEGETSQEGIHDPEASASAQTLSADELAVLNQALEVLGTMDLSKEFREAGLSVETAPDGSQRIKFPEELEKLGDDALLGSVLLQPLKTNDALPTNDSGDDMGLFDKYRICLCSEVTGTLTRDGKPVAGAEVIRRLDLFLPQDQVYTDSTVTDTNGRFAFKPTYARRWKPILGETRIDQKILIRHEGKHYLGWANVSMGLELHGDVFVPTAPKGFYIPLNFNGDLARATLLAEDADLKRIMDGDGFFNSQVVCVASRLHFFVTLNGEPVKGAKVVRTAEHLGYDSYEQSKLTDMDGEVDIPEITAPVLEHKWAKTEIRQKVIITHEGKEYLGWEKTKTNPWDFGEYNIDKDRPMLWAEITADLADNQETLRGVTTDPERCWRGERQTDYLPEDAITYKGLFRVMRFDPGYQKGGK